MSRATLVAVCAALALAGGALGAALVLFLQGPFAAVPQNGERSASSEWAAELIAVLGEVREELEELRHRPARVAVQRSEASEADVCTHLESGDCLQSALEELAAALRSGAIGSPGPIALAADPRPPGPAERRALAELAGKAHRALQIHHFFWTQQQVLERYGIPDEVTDDRWHYRDPVTDRYYTFCFSDQRLIAIYD